MKNKLRKPTIVVVICLLNLLATGQVQYTPYDELPGIIRSYKPAYSDNLPAWAKMLYQSPVNFNDINRDYELYMAQHRGEKSAINRYFQIWRRAVGPFAHPDGTIELPDLQEYYENVRIWLWQASFKVKNFLLTKFKDYDRVL